MTPTDAGDVEEWVQISGFEGLYEVSSTGKIRSLKKGSVLSAPLIGRGYAKATLHKNGQRRQTSVHRLVAEAFLGLGCGQEVNHKNGNKLDNRVANLECVSRSENVNHSYYQLGHLVKPVLVTDLRTGSIETYKSIADAVRSRGFQSAHVQECLSGKRKTHHGHSFEYIQTAPPVREPLTPAEALDAFCKTPGIRQHVQAFVAGVRFAERHHGIKGDPHG